MFSIFFCVFHFFVHGTDITNVVIFFNSCHKPILLQVPTIVRRTKTKALVEYAHKQEFKYFILVLVVILKQLFNNESKTCYSLSVFVVACCIFKVEGKYKYKNTSRHRESTGSFDAKRKAKPNVTCCLSKP